MDPGPHRRLRRARRAALGAAVALLAGACGPGPAAPLQQAACAKSLVGSVSGTVTDPRLTEVSGLVASRTQAGILWTHNDSGDSARIFALDASGAVRAQYTLTGATNVDWEDIALGPGPIPGVEYLYIGDIGDNTLTRTGVQVYRVPEPTVPAGTGSYDLSGAARLELRYPNGARNAESLLVDPRSGAITILMKRVASESIRIYRAPANLAGGSTTTLVDVGQLALPGTTSNATGADISRDARTVLVRTYANVYAYNVASGGSIEAGLATLPCAANITAEPQGEAIAIHADDRGFVTLSEGTNRPLNQRDV